MSDAPEGKENYDIELIAKDAIAVLDKLNIKRARLVAHDWGAMICWFLAGTYPDYFESYTAISVGHPKAYASAGFEQKKRGGTCCFFNSAVSPKKYSWRMTGLLFRKTVHNHPEVDHWIEDLSRPGRLTAGINWYHANLSKLWKGEFPQVKIPVFGIWSTDDVALAEDQMIGSAEYVDAQWRYERIKGVSHWVPVDDPDILNNHLLDFFK